MCIIIYLLSCFKIQKGNLKTLPSNALNILTIDAGIFAAVWKTAANILVVHSPDGGNYNAQFKTRYCSSDRKLSQYFYNFVLLTEATTLKSKAKKATPGGQFFCTLRQLLKGRSGYFRISKRTGENEVTVERKFGITDFGSFQN